MSEDTLYKAAIKLLESSGFQAFRKRRRDWWKIINREDTINLGKLYHDVPALRYHTFKPQHELNQFSAVLDTASTTASVHARSERAEEKQKAQNWEQWLNTAIPVMARGKSSPLRISRSQRTAIGVGIWKFDLRSEWLRRPNETDDDYRERLKSDREQKLRLGLPFIWTSPDPLTCAWFESDADIPLVVEQSERPVNPILREFGYRYENGDFSELGQGEPVDMRMEHALETVTFTQISTDDTIAFYVKGKKESKLLRSYENPWGRPPYIIVPGLLQAGAATPDRKYIPLILGALTQAEYDNFAESITMLAAYLTGTPTYDLFRKDSGSPYLNEQNEQITFEVKPGEPMVYPLPEGAEWRQRTIAMGIDMDKLRARIRADAQEFGFPSGLAGDMPQPRTPAYAYAEASGRAMLHIDPAKRAEESAFVEMADMLGYCIANYIKEDIPIPGSIEDEEGKVKEAILSIGPGDIGEFDVTMGVTVASTSLDMAKREMQRKELEVGNLSQETYMGEDMGIKDVAKEKRLILEGDLKKILKPSLLSHAVQIINEKVRARTGSAIPVPEGAEPFLSLLLLDDTRSLVSGCFGSLPDRTN